MHFIWKLHVQVPFKVLSSPTDTLIPTTVLVRFFYYGFQPFRRICLNLRNRLKFSSFEVLFKFLELEKITRSKFRGVEGWGRIEIECLAKNSRVLSGLKRCRDAKTCCHFSTVLAFCVGQRPSDVSVHQCNKSG